MLGVIPCDVAPCFRFYTERVTARATGITTLSSISEVLVHRGRTPLTEVHHADLRSQSSSSGRSRVQLYVVSVAPRVVGPGMSTSLRSWEHGLARLVPYSRTSQVSRFSTTSAQDLFSFSEIITSRASPRVQICRPPNG